MPRCRKRGPRKALSPKRTGFALRPGVQFAGGHLGRELEIGALAVLGVEWETEAVRVAGGLPDLVLRCEAEHRALDRRRRPVGPRVRLERDVGLARDVDRRIRDLDGGPLHPDVISDQWLEFAEGTTDVTRDDLLDGLGLLVGGSLVDDDSDLPVPRCEVRGEPVIEHEAHAPELDVVEVPVLNSEHKRTAALAICRLSAGRRPGTGTPLRNHMPRGRYLQFDTPYASSLAQDQSSLRPSGTRASFPSRARRCWDPSSPARCPVRPRSRSRARRTRPPAPSSAAAHTGAPSPRRSRSRSRPSRRGS